MTFQKAYEGWKEFIERFSFENKEDIFEVYKTYTTRWNSYLENMTLAAFTKESPYRLRAGKSVVLPIIEAFFKEPFYQAYEGIQSPVMLIHTSDPAELEGAREKGIRTLKEKVVGVEIHRKIGGHNLHWDDPDGIADMVKDFKARIKA
jgi:hypothetical protein